MVKATGKIKSIPVTMRVDRVTNQLWEDAANLLGMSKTAFAEMSIRKIARAEGVAERDQEEEETTVNV